MHHCFEIDEVLSLICDHVYWPLAVDDSRPERKDQLRTALRDLYHLSLTCRSFSGTALDALWRTQWSLGPLLMLMPPARICVSPTFPPGRKLISVSLESPPGPSDWENIASFTGRIRVMYKHCPLRNKIIVDANALSTLMQTCPTSSLLPNLSCVTQSFLPLSNPGFRMHFGRMLSNSLVALCFWLPVGLPSADVNAVARILVDRSPMLKSVFVNISDSVPLASFVEPISTSLLDLQTFELSLSNHLPLVVSDRIQPFPRLQTLILKCGAPQMIDLLQSIQAINLERLHLAINPSSASEDDTSNPTSTLGSQIRWSKSLRSLVITLCNITQPLPFTPEHLYVFSNLNTLQLYYIECIMTETILVEMAKAWPRMERLIIMPIGAARMEPCAITCLAAFAMHCPKLQLLDLGIMLNASILPTSYPKGSTQRATLRDRVPGPKELLIAIHRGSPIDKPEAVAAYIHGLFPSRYAQLDLKIHSNADKYDSLWKSAQHALCCMQS
ncbi:hypothetical protein HYDPIDRAFT_108826 [Hydnomerulius pinastri MD-312]|nr:hypothetical protein HYDPIDRAFT_108826 [Hydnomerulius pinastri MD-312]